MFKMTKSTRENVMKYETRDGEESFYKKKEE